MQMAFFAVPARGDNGLQESLNAFLRSHRVLTVHREFVGQGDNSFWALAVEYLEGAAGATSGSSGSRKPRVDYKEVLTPGDFAVFAKLRDWRKTTAEQVGIPVYAILTNEQLAAIATTRPSSLTQLRDVEGIGEAKTGKYGEGVLAVVKQYGVSSSVPTAKSDDTDTDDTAGACSEEVADETGR
jgi:superfamily II DNA helicase RecQ